jgi:DNA-binding MarR family transcriptional regulator
VKRSAADLEALKKRGVSQLLFKCARLLNDRAVARVNQRSRARVLRASHTALFPHLGAQGIRSTELAQRLGVTKQSVSQLVTELESWGMVTQTPDPQDGRAKLVKLSDKGHKAMLDGLSVLAELEGELVSRIGKRRMQELQTALSALEAELDLGLEEED